VQARTPAISVDFDSSTSAAENTVSHHSTTAHCHGNFEQSAIAVMLDGAAMTRQRRRVHDSMGASAATRHS
jgi:hypothetical protein